ncbi:P-loop containing nucleoside triphosphate hydrolase protein [Marasmius fiardii PR-910]|nr:P-loop containing nucleoside triphosphate hydrolase protein [Marasmius fiardii PR-910]
MSMKQYYVDEEKSQVKSDKIHEWCNKAKNTVIFCNTNGPVVWLADEMRAKGFTVSAMHDDTEKTEVAVAKETFYSGGSRILISTDAPACKSLDLHEVALVINYDLPDRARTYIHRIGLEGRFGGKGIAITFLSTEEDPKMVKEIEKVYNVKLEEMSASLDFSIF